MHRQRKIRFSAFHTQPFTNPRQAKDKYSPHESTQQTHLVASAVYHVWNFITYDRLHCFTSPKSMIDDRVDVRVILILEEHPKVFISFPRIRETPKKREVMDDRLSKDKLDCFRYAFVDRI